MGKKEENWVKKQMFYEEEGSRTFYCAQRLWLIENDYYKSNWVKKLWLLFQVKNNGRLIMKEVKPIQDKLIDKMMKLNSQSKPKTK